MLTDAAWVFYSVQKYSEAPTAGTALVADIPHDRMREFRQAAVEVSNAMSLEQLQAAVKWWLEHPEELRNKAATGQQWATHNVLTTHFFEQVTELYFEMSSAGGKAMVGRAFPSPFYVRCRGAGGERWCKEKQKGKLPHYHSPEAAKHPASGGPVPTVTPPDTACAGIAPPAYQSRWRPLRWLLLQTKAAATTATDPSYRRLAAQSDHAYVKVIAHWGPGFTEYDESRTLAENIKAKFGEQDFFDVILTDDDWPKPDETAAFHARRTVVVVRRLECVQKTDCAESLRAHSPSIVLLGNPFEAMYNAELTDLSTRSLIVHQPRFSVPALHVDLSQPGEKATDVLLVRRPGQNAESYPMMERWATVCASLKSAGKNVEVFDAAAPTEGTDAAAADEELAGRIRRAKIVLGSAGAARYAPADWEEALVAGALVISDMPYDRVREFRRLSVEVAADASAEQLQAAVEQWLGDGAGRLGKVQEGQAWVRFRCGRVVWWSHESHGCWCLVVAGGEERPGQQLHRRRDGSLPRGDGTTFRRGARGQEVSGEHGHLPARLSDELCSSHTTPCCSGTGTPRAARAGARRGARVTPRRRSARTGRPEQTRHRRLSLDSLRLRIDVRAKRNCEVDVQRARGGGQGTSQRTARWSFAAQASNWRAGTRTTQGS